MYSSFNIIFSKPVKNFQTVFDPFFCFLILFFFFFFFLMKKNTGSKGSAGSAGFGGSLV